MKFIDLTGQRFGKLVAMKRAPNPYSESTHEGAFFLCLCDCGKETVVASSNLRRNHTTSCGCQNQLDLVGQYFGKLLVLSEFLARVEKIHTHQQNKRLETIK